MIGLGKEGKLEIRTPDSSDTHVYNLKAMVRVLGMAFSSDVDADDRDLMITYCRLLESMLPCEGQLDIGAVDMPKGKINSFFDGMPSER